MALRTIHSVFGCRGLAKRILPENPAEKNILPFKILSYNNLKYVSFTRLQDHETVSTLSPILDLRPSIGLD